MHDVERALEHARSVKDPQAIVPTLAFAVRCYAELGRAADARKLASELLELARPLNAPTYSYINFAWVARKVGCSDELRDLLTRYARQTRWIAAARAVVDEAFADAAKLFAEMPSRPHEAWARLRLAESLLAWGRRSEGDAELQRALGFFRSVGATRYVRLGEALLAAAS